MVYGCCVGVICMWMFFFFCVGWVVGVCGGVCWVCMGFVVGVLWWCIIIIIVIVVMISSRLM